MDESKEKARLRRAQKAALMNGAQGRMFTVTYQDCQRPGTPVEEVSRDYNELGLYLHGETVKTAMELWEMLPGWMEARRMAFVDPEYNRRMSELIAQLAEPVLKAAKEMAEWEPAECAPGRKDERSKPWNVT